MVIVMGLKSNSVQKLEEAWQVSMHECKGDDGGCVIREVGGKGAFYLD
jgi:hypothetical protein